MSGFIGNDGSELIGGLNPSNVVTAFRTNALGDLRTGRDVTHITGLTANALNALLLPSMDVSAYSFFSFHSGAGFSATYQFQGSNDNVDFVPFTCFRLDNMSSNNANVQSSGTTQLWGAPLPFRYLQIQVVTYASGNVNGTLELFTGPITLPVIEQLAFQDGAWNVGLTAGSNVIGSISNDGTNTTAIAAATAGNTVIKATAGRLARILVTATGTVTMLLYDNATTNSGTIIGVVKSGAVVGDIIELRTPAANGITVGGNAGNAGVTIVWS
nr:hypothetical protein [Ktedonobacteraceae bacterium]